MCSVLLQFCSVAEGIAHLFAYNAYLALGCLFFANEPTLQGKGQFFEDRCIGKLTLHGVTTVFLGSKDFLIFYFSGVFTLANSSYSSIISNPQ